MLLIARKALALAHNKTIRLTTREVHCLSSILASPPLVSLDLPENWVPYSHPPSPVAFEGEHKTVVIDGKAIAEEIRTKIVSEVWKMKNDVGKVPGLAVVLVGEQRDSQTYVRNKIKACEETGIKSVLAEMVMVKAVKWVDEVISDAPYAITEDFMKRLFDEYQIDYIIHGDDPCVLPDGTDAYALAKKAGRYKQIKRTEGVSSTDIVGRMLLCVRERSNSNSHSSLQRQFSHGHNSPKFDDGGSSAGTRVSHFLPTSRRIVQFSNGKVRKS
ncbi:hypothetical protein DY000_02035580 [Brassica cretica]|uniref:Tetrahydrofolate dehydrogenase/cyclohydrolase catalytic domain-containing protein n=1 Tax=Brassica cretica TaxID=69181 RepID=A0ABQ7DY89_BRACR|nr:hypothetical protein DY000_02035580 [Brassica cretica]